MYDIMVYEGALYVPHSGDFACSSVNRMWFSTFELCVVLVLVYCSLYVQ